jgi:hypothetical protein
MPTPAMSLWRTDCWLRLSHFNVTPDQFVSVTVAWSFLSSRQQTRAPMLKVLDWEPVIRFAVSQFEKVTVSSKTGDCHDRFGSQVRKPSRALLPTVRLSVGPDYPGNARLGFDQGQDASGNASIRNCMKALTLLLTNFCEVWRTQTST